MKVTSGQSSGSGTVTSVSIVSANGFAGSVATASSSPAITLSTSITGLLKGNGTAISAAAAGTDYQAVIDNTTALTVNSLTLSGNISTSAWTTNGVRIKGSASTFTDTTSSGTVAAAYTNVWGGNTVAATNVTTFTDYFNTYIKVPVAGSNVTFTNSWSLGLEGAMKAPSVTLATGTITTSQPAVNSTQTWNAVGTTFTGLFLNVTDTASASASKLLDLQVGGTSRFAIGKNGNIVFQRTPTALTTGMVQVAEDNSGNNKPGILCARNTDGTSPIFQTFGGGGVGNNGQVSVKDLQISSKIIINGSLTPGSTPFEAFECFLGVSASGSPDLCFARDGADAFAQRRGTNAQTRRVYNTYTDLSNYERNTVTWVSNVCYQKNENAGTGSARLYIPVTGSTTVAGLPSAATAGVGARSFVTDATATTFLSTVAGGGANKVPVVSDGTNWLIG